MAIENELEEERVNKLNELEQIEKLEQAVAKLAGNGPLMLNLTLNMIHQLQAISTSHET